MELKSVPSRGTLILNGVLKSIFAAFLGGMVFVTIVVLLPASRSYDGTVWSAVFGILLVLALGAIFAMPPACIGGILTSLLIYRGIERERLTEQKSFYIGVAVGSLSTFAFCTCVTAMSFNVGPGHGYQYSISSFDWSRYALYSIVAVGIAAVAGGLTARSIFRDMKRKIFIATPNKKPYLKEIIL